MWWATKWVPSQPRRNAGIRSLLHFGGTVTLNTLVVYVAYNFEKVLLGRYWGADALGNYERAYQLINMPTGNLNSAIGGVAFSALSRLHDDPARLKHYFLRGYFLVVSMTVPCTLFAALFADDIVLVILGSKWVDAALIFRLLTPTILVFGMINPLSWLLLSIGLQGRSLRIALVIAPLVMTAYVIGLPYGPTGVAIAYSAAMTLWLVPHVVWCLHKTIVAPGDLLRAISGPFVATVAAGACAVAAQHYFGQLPSAIEILALGGGVMFVVYLWILLFVLRHKTFYLDLFKELKGYAPARATGFPPPHYDREGAPSFRVD